MPRLSRAFLGSFILFIHGSDPNDEVSGEAKPRRGGQSRQIGVGFLSMTSLPKRPLTMTALPALLTALSLALTSLSESLVAHAAFLERTIVIHPAPVIGIWDGYADLKRFCSCESWGTPEKEPRQYYDNGDVIWGNDPKTGLPVKRDVGACQINIAVHSSTYERMGLDVIGKFEDNVTFAKYLYDRDGWWPWKASKATCWKNLIK